MGGSARTPLARQISSHKNSASFSEAGDTGAGAVLEELQSVLDLQQQVLARTAEAQVKAEDQVRDAEQRALKADREILKLLQARVAGGTISNMGGAPGVTCNAAH